MTEKKIDQKKYQFKAEIKQLLDILVHSLYTHRDIFVRELVSNAADALDKVRFEEVRGTRLINPDLPYEINIDVDEKKKTFTITDTGIGMTRDELISNIGTIAHSGSADFLKRISDQEQKGPELIGKFGVGFYSVFMAGEQVVITTQSFLPDSEPCQWRSDGTGSYIITTIDKAPRGTKIEVQLREDAHEFAEQSRIEEVIKKYSNFVPFPIKINGVQINTISAIWREPKSSIKDEQYNDFFKFIANSTEDPLTYLHISSDAPIQFNSLLFIPKTNDEIFDMMPHDEGVNLFVKRILVQPHCKDLLPHYLHFIRGVVDSEDLPLNISRETLQENTEIARIKSVLVKKILGHLSELAEKETEKYSRFWKDFGRIFKEGYMDYAHRERVIDLFRFNSSSCKNAEEYISMQTYADRMLAGQEEIYYLSGPNREAIERNPHLEIFRKKEIEVLYLYEPIDEFVMADIQKYRDKKLQSIDQFDPQKIKAIPATEEKAESDKSEQIDERKLADLCARIKNILGDRVTEVRASERLTDSPAVLINPDGTLSTQMQKIMLTISKESKMPAKIMELNGKHPLIQNMLKIYLADPKDEYLSQATENLFNSVLLLDGYLPDPYEMVAGIQQLLLNSSHLHVKNK